MSSDGFVKVYETILDSSVWGAPHATRIVWMTLLVMSDQDGRVRASRSGLARRAVVDPADLDAALAYLESPDPEDTSGEEGGRRIVPVPGGWQIVNRTRYRDRRSHKQEADAERQRRHRAKAVTDGVTACDITPGHAPSQSVALETETETEKIPPIGPPEGEPTQARGPKLSTRRAPPKRKPPARPIPDDWQPTDKHRELARKEGRNLDREAQRFRDHAAASGRRQVDWDAAFRTWLMSDYGRPQQQGPPQPNGSGKFFDATTLTSRP